MKHTSHQRHTERGNVLFLILIAVALFAALSYAVTQSTRSGGGDAGRETSLVNSAAITQYPASIKTSIVRMIVSNGVTVDNLTFDDPSLFTANLTTPALQAANVFHPSGGGANYSQAPNAVMANNLPGTWVFNAQNRVWNIGTDTTSTAGVDIVAILPSVTQAICERIHSQLGLGAVPTLSNVILNTPKLSTAAAITYTATAIIGNSGGASVLNGQPQGCFQQPANTYNYYHVLVER